MVADAPLRPEVDSYRNVISREELSDSALFLGSNGDVSCPAWLSEGQ